MYQNLNVNTKIIKLLHENTVLILHDLGLGNGFLDTTPPPPKLTSKLKLLCFKRYHQESEKTSHRMRENFCKPSICKELVYRIYKEQ